MLVPVAAFEGSRSGWCFDNVRRRIEADGGDAVHGYTVWTARGFWHNAEFHAVWRSPAGDLVDVTPKTDGESYVIFASDGRYGPNFDFYLRPGNVRVRAYAHEERKPSVAGKIAALSERRLAYEKEKAARKGLSISQSLGMSLRGRDRLEFLIDKFLEDVGRYESMLTPTSAGMVLKEPRRQREFERLGADLMRQRTKLYLIADMAVRGMVPR